MKHASDAESVTINAKDGYQLAGLYYPSTSLSKGKIIVAGATGVPQQFYKNFCEYAAGCGFSVLTFDYRGLGLSKHGSLKGFKAGYFDWAGDLSSAVDYMKTDELPLFIVGHSFGGHAYGLIPNHYLVDGACFFATGAGWNGYMPFAERMKTEVLWKLIMPVINFFKGYMAWKVLGMGEDLPRDVYLNWKRWCGFPHYFFDDPEQKDLAEKFDKINVPLRIANSLDDLWALPVSRDGFLKYAYRNCSVEKVNIEPDDVTGPIGHMGYFRKNCKPLWAQTIEWIETNMPSTKTQADVG